MQSGLTTITNRHPGDNFGSNCCKAAAIRRLIRLRTTARLLTLVLTEIPIRVGSLQSLLRFMDEALVLLGRAVSFKLVADSVVEGDGRKALNVK
ncbi:hypothetical protein NIES4071_92560 [Calothrix sp. NIES-4071]|nr:hypothetical protein NIES4071_92560 [Calothrix sp. NIES-4071]BAZ63523.1 hypothetical protein NIES4105_92490 [Calothrix sp. NIES-4105]